MTAHNPITAAKAVSMVEAIGVANARQLLADHASADLLKSYALVIETEEAGGRRRVVRGAIVPLELWRRIIREDAADHVWTGGTVRLAASGFVGGPPEVSITGFGFDRKGVARLIDHLGGRDPNAAARPIKPASVVEEVAEPTTSLSRQRRRADPDAIPAGALLVTINQTMAALGLGRTKVNELMQTGRLERREIDGGVRITAASIVALASGPMSEPSA